VHNVEVRPIRVATDVRSVEYTVGGRDNAKVVVEKEWMGELGSGGKGESGRVLLEMAVREIARVEWMTHVLYRAPKLSVEGNQCGRGRRRSRCPCPLRMELLEPIDRGD
jgi:hypothetical protein